MSSKFDSVFNKLRIPNNNLEAFFLALLVGFALLVRVVPFELITIFTLLFFLGIFALDFFMYTNKLAKEENKNIKTTEFSWGFVKEKKEIMDINTFLEYLSNKDFSYYKSYILINIDKLIILLFVFSDILVAFKNLDMRNSGIYIAMSLFTKFVFIGYVLMKQTFDKTLISEKTTEENILEIFYTQINTMLSSFAALFIFFFLLSKYLVEIFFGQAFTFFQTSLPFILLANISLVVALCIFMTSIKLDEKVTLKISKFFLAIIFILFIFIAINYIDTVTYFIIGSSALLSIFLYNFVIKKPSYIESTYNHLF